MNSRRKYSLWTHWLLLAGGAGVALVYSGFILAWVRTSGSGEGSFVEIGISLVLGMALIFLGSYRRTTPITLYQLIYLFPIGVYFFVAIAGALAASDGKILAWLLFGLAYLVLMSFVNVTRLRIIEGFLLVALIELMFFLAFNREAIFSYSGGRGRVSFDNQAYTLTAYAIAGGTVAALYSLVFQGRAHLRSLAVLGLSIIIILGTGTRSVLVGLFAAVFSLYFVNKITGSTLKRVALYSISAAVAAGVLFALIPTLQDRLLNTFDLIVSGVSTLSGDQANFEQSAEGRRISREIGYYNFAQNPLAGAGFFTRQLDFPLLQSYQDFGMGFGLCFTFAFLVLPYLVAFKAFRHGTDQEKFLAALYILNSPRLFLHGTTYDWVIFIYVMPIYSMLLNRPEWGLLFNRPKQKRPRQLMRMEGMNV